MRLGSAALLIVALILIPAAGHSQQADARQPVPASALQGKMLVVADLGFSIESPGPKWTWTKTETPVAKRVQFYCTNPETPENYMVSVVQLDTPLALNRADADRYIAEVAQGTGTRSNGCTPWPAVQGGWRCALSAENTKKEPFQLIRYIVSTSRFYSIQSPRFGSAEPPLFKTFAASFKLLK